LEPVKLLGFPQVVRWRILFIHRSPPDFFQAFVRGAALKSPLCSLADLRRGLLEAADNATRKIALRDFQISRQPV
jgi:hypothetical protein